MSYLFTQLNNLFKTAIKNANYDVNADKYIQACKLETLGDFQCNIALSLAKEYKKSPMEIATNIKDNLPTNEFIENISIAKPGFINFFVKDEFLTECMRKEYKNLNKKLNLSNKTIIVDYGGANVAKPLHVGHLRSANIGESIKQICSFVGNNTIGDVHLGDWGLQMGMIISELKRRHPDWIYFQDKDNIIYPNKSPITIKDLETLYPEANAKAKADENIMNEAKLATYELQNGNKGYMALWQHILNVSKADLKKNYDKLNVNFELWLGESDTRFYYDDVINQIVKNGYATKSQGALIVDVAEPEDKIEVPPFILKKTDGAVLYSTTDLATIVQREKDYNVDKIIYVIDNRQSMHFTQLFRCVKKVKILKKDIEFEFAGFGTMNGKDGKPYKTRSGGVLQLQALIKEVEQKAKQKLLERQNQTETISNAQINNIASKVAVSALKFADLSTYRTKDYIFDIDKFCSFDGKTGPYILYTITRARSILNKAKNSIKDTSSTQFNSKYYNKQFALALMNCNDEIIKSYNELAPNVLCDYAYELANHFNTFYNTCNIINETNSEKQQALLSLTTYTLKTLEKLMKLLGIKTLNRM